jgi:asparagine synthetase B (glutamine-hydrolysing)
MAWETDWLGLQSVFYHELTGNASHHLDQVVDHANFAWDQDGLANYVRFGYCVFGHTPVRHVRFLPAGARLVQGPGGQWGPELHQPDGWFADRLATRTTPEQVVGLARAHIRAWEAAQTEGPLVLPLSGGFDSRFIVSALAQPQRVRAFTYSLLPNPAESLEVAYAQFLAQRLELATWQVVDLGGFLAYLPAWHARYGCATHAHGMYQMAFYDQLQQRGLAGRPLASGLLGDNFAGKMEVPPIGSPADLVHLGYTHGLHADPAQLVAQPRPNAVNEAFFAQKREFLADARCRVLEAVRTKAMLLRYLAEEPAHYGFRPYAPFAEPEVALAMLALPENERKNRQWQHDYFAKLGLYPEALPQRPSQENDLNQYALLRNPLPPLSETTLGELFAPAYVRWINRNLLNNNASRFEFWYLRHFRTTRLLWRLARRTHLAALAAYQTLYPLQCLIEERERRIK